MKKCLFWGVLFGFWCEILFYKGLKNIMDCCNAFLDEEKPLKTLLKGNGDAPQKTSSKNQQAKRPPCHAVLSPFFAQSGELYDHFNKVIQHSTKPLPLPVHWSAPHHL